MQALILAGGLGTRLRSVVNDKPKPMAAVSDKPFIEYQIEFLKRYDINHLILCVGYLYEQIQNYFGNGGKWGIRIDYSIEKELLGTAGALKQAQSFIDETFLVLNGDTYFDINLKDLIKFHQRKNAEHDSIGTLALTAIQDARNFGAVTIDAEHKILRFEEKAERAEASKLINAGIYVLAPEILQHIPSAQKVSLEKETFPALLNQGHRLFGYETTGYFVDIGTPAGYQGFQQYISGMRS
ncbi:MAG: nucleotidyltransferase family protein [bacterium]